MNRLARWWKSLPVGTKSVLLGAHCFFIHPWFVALAWWKLYGWKRITCPSTGVVTGMLDLRLWLCFLVHDLGYWKTAEMDGEEGEKHPQFGANIVGRLFDKPGSEETIWLQTGCCRRPITRTIPPTHDWHDFLLLHSRWYAKALDRRPSAFCMADKLAIALTPGWLYVPMARLSGEIKEYRSRETRPDTSKGWDDWYANHNATDYEWFKKVQAWVITYVEEHKDGRPDTWTPERANGEEKHYVSDK